MRDLHLHLSGATSFRVIWEGIVESGHKTGISGYEGLCKMLSITQDCTGLDQYLEVIHHIDRIQSSPLSVRRSVYDAFTCSYLAGCKYLELRFNPVKRSQDGQIDLDQIIIAARAGMEKACNTFGIEGGLILCMGRDISMEANEAIFSKAVKYYKKGVIGIDLAGSEFIPINPDFRSYFQSAKAYGLVTTIHTGEVDKPDSGDEMQFVLEKIRPTRIGHGIKMARYSGLLSVAAKAGIIFEICPTSNVMTRAVDSFSELGVILKKLTASGVKWEVCTDATSPLNTNIHRENSLVRDILS